MLAILARLVLLAVATPCRLTDGAAKFLVADTSSPYKHKAKYQEYGYTVCSRPTSRSSAHAYVAESLPIGNLVVWTHHLHPMVSCLSAQVPSGSYRYRIVGGQQHWYFQAAPAPSPDTEFTFLGFGDMGDAVHPEAKSPG
jgi:hypothetical protein